MKWFAGGPQEPFIDVDCRVLDQHGFHGPRRFDGVFTGKQRVVTVHRVGQQALVGRLLAGLLFEQRELALVADEFLAGPLDAGGERDRRVR